MICVCQRDGWLRTLVLLAAGLAYWPAWSVADEGTAAEKTTAPQQVEPVEIKAEPLKLPVGGPLSSRALVARPIPIRGVMSWSLETRRHRGAIFTVALSPDGKTVATGGIDGTIRLWDVETGNFLKALIGHDSYIYHLAWSPDGQTLASAGSWDATARLWDVKSGLLLRTIRHEKGYVSLVAWSPTGTRLAFAGGESGTVNIHNVTPGEIVKPTALGVPVNTLCWAPDGLSLAFTGPQTPISIWTLSGDETGKGRGIDTNGDVTYSFAWSPDGKTLAAGGAKGIRVFNVESGDVVRTIEAPAVTVAYSPDGNTLASAASGGVVQLWEAATGKAIKTLMGSATSFLTWSADGSRLATGISTSAAVWDVAEAKLKKNFDVGGIYPPQWSPGKPMLTGIYTATLSVWDANTGKRIGKLEGHKGGILATAWTRDGKTLATGAADNTVRLWDVAAGTSFATLEGHTAAVQSVAWMADGKTLASGSADKTIRVWKAPEHKSASTKSSASKSTTNETDEKPAADSPSPATDATATKSASSKKAADVLLQTFKGHEGPVTHLAFAPTAKMLASGSSDKSARLWNITTGKQVSSMNVGWPVYALTWAPDGKTLGTSGADERLNFWNPVKGELLQHLDHPGSPPSVSSIAWSPNGGVIASGRRNHTLQLWNARDGKLVVPSLAAMAPVVSVTWTPGGSTIAAACEDRAVRFWDASSGQLRGHLIAEDNEIVAIAAEGHFRADPGIETDLFYVVQTEKTQETLSISDFVAKSKLKNVPAQAKIMGN